MLCDEVATLLPSFLDGPVAAPAPVVDHVETCLRCQAEAARYRVLLRMLNQLVGDRPDPPAGLLGEVLGLLETAAKRHAIRSALTGRRIAYGGGAAAVAAGAALTLVVLGRTRAERRPAGV